MRLSTCQLGSSTLALNTGKLESEKLTENALARSVIHNQGAAKRCQGAAKAGITAFIVILQHRVPQIFIFKTSGVPPIIFKDLKGTVKQKKVE